MSVRKFSFHQESECSSAHTHQCVSDPVVVELEYCCFSELSFLPFPLLSFYADYTLQQFITCFNLDTVRKLFSTDFYNCCRISVPKSSVPQMNTVLVMILLDHIHFFCILSWYRSLMILPSASTLLPFLNNAVSVLQHYNIALLCEFID